MQYGYIYNLLLFCYNVLRTKSQMQYAAEDSFLLHSQQVVFAGCLRLRLCEALTVLVAAVPLCNGPCIPPAGRIALSTHFSVAGLQGLQEPGGKGW